MMILKLSQHFPLRVTDWLVGGILTSWGIVCLYLTPEAWLQPTYSGLRAIAAQQTWGMFALVIGMVRMTALFINGAVRRTPHARGICAFLSIFLWLQMTLALFNAEIGSIGVAIYPWLFLADIYNVYRAAQDARHSDLRYQAQRENRLDALSAEH